MKRINKIGFSLLGIGMALCLFAVWCLDSLEPMRASEFVSLISFVALVGGACIIASVVSFTIQGLGGDRFPMD